MKNTVLIFLLVVMMFIISGCGKSDNVSKKENIEEYTQKNLNDVDAKSSDKNNQEANDIYRITIEEAQKNKKLITVMENNYLVFMYENKIYGLEQAEIEKWKDNLSGKSIVQIEPLERSIMILDSEGIVSLLYRGDGAVINSKGDYIYYKNGLNGNRDIYIFTEDGKCLICNNYYYYSEQRGKELNVQNIKSMIYGSSGDIDMRLLLKNDGTVAALKSEILSGRSVDVETDPVWNIDKTDFKLSIDLSNWTNIECLAFDSSNEWVAGLKSDGTIIFSGNDYPEEASKWQSIVDIKAVNDGIIGLQTDGTLICSNNLTEIEEQVKEWKDIQMFYASNSDCGRIAAVNKEGICYLDNFYISSNIVVEYKDSEYIVEEMDETEYLDWQKDIHEKGLFYIH